MGQEALGVDRPVEHEMCNDPSQVRPARNVVVFPWPFGASPMARALTSAQA
ncbi:hypothetical protein [Bradyrhizobium sp. WSM2793]|uniref:hypothetical protein n=1 Tax=Bradyrhizobium sp. WSM2793 TaxID=1038866 RepID=UPI000381C8BE|nr:hypothetical protein [Bradyrhizobium sp. WSM2793]